MPTEDRKLFAELRLLCTEVRRLAADSSIGALPLEAEEALALRVASLAGRLFDHARERQSLVLMDQADPITTDIALESMHDWKPKGPASLLHLRTEENQHLITQELLAALSRVSSDLSAITEQLASGTLHIDRATQFGKLLIDIGELIAAAH